MKLPQTKAAKASAEKARAEIKAAEDKKTRDAAAMSHLADLLYPRT